MGATFVTGSGGQSTTSAGANVTWTYPVAILQNDLLIAVLQGGPGGTIPNFSMTSDSSGNTNWNRADGNTAGNSADLELWYCWGANAASSLSMQFTDNHFTSFSPTCMGYCTVRGAKSSGSPLDVHISTTGTLAIATAGPVTPNNNGIAIVGYYDQNGGVGVGGGFTQFGNAGSGNGQYAAAIAGTPISGTGTSTSPSFSIAIIAVFSDANVVPKVLPNDACFFGMT